MPDYGASLNDWAAQFKDWLPQSDDRDWSLDAAIYIGLAVASLHRLQGLGVSLQAHHKPNLVLSTLELAWRELLHVRLTRLPESVIVNDVKRPIGLTKTGKVADYGKRANTLLFDRRYYSDTERKTEYRIRNAVASGKDRLRVRGARKPGSPADAGDRKPDH